MKVFWYFRAFNKCMKKKRKIILISSMLLTAVLLSGAEQKLQAATLPPGAEQKLQAKQEEQNNKIRICILDSGCSDPEITGWNYVDQNDDLTDTSGHGTKICHLLQEQIPQAELIMLKCFEIEEMEEEKEGRIVQALQDATELYHADVINMSWATVTESEIVHEAVRKADKEGCILVASAGNLSMQTPLGSTVYPAAWEEVIGVGGVNLDENREPSTSLWYLQSEAVYVCADGAYDGEKGSSFAAPRVAGVIAAYLQESEGQTSEAVQECESPEFENVTRSRREEVQEYLRKIASDLNTEGYDTVTGWGYIEAIH